MTGKSRRFHNDGVGKVILSPGEEKTVWAMKWVTKSDEAFMAFAPDGTIQVTDDDKSHLFILLKMKLYPWRRD